MYRVQTAKVIYLDQNKWIQLAKIHNGKSTDAASKQVLNFIKAKTQSGEMVLPLFETHYLETAKNKNEGQRQRLGEVMWKVSGGYTIASKYQTMCYDIEVALGRHFPGIKPRGFQLLSRGLGHAFDVDYSFSIPLALRVILSPEQIRDEEQKGQEMLEKAAITGVGPGGKRFDPPDATQINKKFQAHLETLPSKLSELSYGEQMDALYAMAILDIKEPLGDVLNLHNLSFDSDFLKLSKKQFREFVDDIPARRLEMHLHMQILKNPQLKPKLNDLEDWSGLGYATSHCDVVVCERHFANLVSRDGFRTNARVLTDLRDLPNVV